MSHDDVPEGGRPGASGAAASPAPRPTRRMDARSLRGLAHPLRMRILELLTLDGPDTATGLARRLGESTGTVSWHLRRLADHDFIEEEADRGTRRERWWRAVPVSRQLNTTDFRNDPDARGPLSLYVHELVQQHFHQVAGYLAEDWGPEWRDAGTITQWHDLTLTSDQLAALNGDLAEVVERHRAAAAEQSGTAPGDPAAPAADAARRPVIVQLQSFPRKPRTDRAVPPDTTDRAEPAERAEPAQRTGRTGRTERAEP